jgi:hypothetical protein
VKRLNHLREPGESYRDAILALAEGSRGAVRLTGGCATDASGCFFASTFNVPYNGIGSYCGPRQTFHHMC